MSEKAALTLEIHEGRLHSDIIAHYDQEEHTQYVYHKNTKKLYAKQGSMVFSRFFDNKLMKGVQSGGFNISEHEVTIIQSVNN